MGRTLGFLFIGDIAYCVEPLAYGQRRKMFDLVAVFAFVLFAALLLKRKIHDFQKSAEIDLRRARGENIRVGERGLTGDEARRLNRRSRVRHLAREESAPDEIVKLKLRRVEPRRSGSTRHVGRTDGLVGSLGVRL